MGVLQMREVSKRFGGVQALAGVDLDVREWEIVGVIGPNGAGKTTLFNCATGFVTPDEGRIVYDGEDITHLPTHRRAAVGLARTFQNVGLVKSLSVLDNLLIAQHLQVRYSLVRAFLPLPDVLGEEEHLRENAGEVLRFLDLYDLRDTTIDGLPYGTLKRVELAQALTTDPRVLLLDEPTSGMGPEEAHGLGALLRRVRDELGVTVVLIEHHVPLVVDVCDYVYCLNFGQVLAQGEPEAVRDHPEVQTAYLGREVA